MPVSKGLNAWPPPAHHGLNGARLSQLRADDAVARTATPVDNPPELMPEASIDAESENRRAHFADLYRKSEAKLAQLFCEDGGYNDAAIVELEQATLAPPPVLPPATDDTPAQEPPRKKVKRTIDEDDYDDDYDDEEGEDEVPAKELSSFKGKGVADASAAAASMLLSPSKSGSSPVQSVTSPGKTSDKNKDSESSQQSQAKTSEDARKLLEESRSATEDEVRRSFHTLFYTLEHDRTAMIEQQQLEESERQLQAEMDSNTNQNHNNNAAAASGAQNGHGSLSSANLGASSLTLKHLIARIDMKRDQVAASDAELRLLMNEVRKNRSKWASEENVNQEELYEALEKVLTELKAHTEFSTPFLARVNKRDAPDYNSIIKHPMDLGTMTKKLKGLVYKSKAEFVTDLNLIWDNCLKYNQDMNHPLRRMANGMRKEAEKLIPLIPDLAIRSRAEVEAEERRKQNGGDDDGGDDSDDEPIMSSRGRIAGAKGTAKSRKSKPNEKEGTPHVDKKPHLQVNGILAKHGRESSEAVDSNGFATPPIAGSSTPIGLNGLPGAVGSTGDAMEIDGPSLRDMALGEAMGEAQAQVHEDEAYKIWKQVTKKDRALVAKERTMLFKDNCLNLDAPALLRTKAGMRRFLKSQRQAEAQGIASTSRMNASDSTGNEMQTNLETLAEEMEGEEERVIPAYYEPMNIVPGVTPSLRWTEDGEGQVINHHDWSLSVVPPDYFKSPTSELTKRIDANNRQIQETRKLATKLSVIRQMQVQTQIYSNQFPRSSFEPFVEADVDQHFISDRGPVMATETVEAALARSVGKIFYQAGFEELQPAALDTVTNVAADYFQKLVRTVNLYREADKKPVPRQAAAAVGVPGTAPRFQPQFTPEEVLLHTLEENGHSVASLESYAKDDLPRLGSKLSSLHDRMKTHLADLLRPALQADAGTDGAGAFKDGSEQFVSGDFAEELGEDFFGFRSLGLEKELGLDTLAVPLHLLQSRMRSQYQQNQAPGEVNEDIMDALPPNEPVTRENIGDQIGLVKNFFLAKLHANGDQPLVEDEDLPPKQRRPRPRLGASGKISSPQKRPLKEQIAMARKRKKLEAQMAAGRLQGSPGKAGAGGAAPSAAAAAAATAAAGAAGPSNPAKKMKMMPSMNGGGTGPNAAVLALGAGAPGMERVGSMHSQGNASQTDKDEPNGMMSPESIDR